MLNRHQIQHSIVIPILTPDDDESDQLVDLVENTPPGGRTPDADIPCGQPDSASPSAGGFPEAAYLSVASKLLVAVTGSSEAAGEIAVTGPPEAARGTSRSVAPPVPLSWQDQVRKAEEELLGEATEGTQNMDKGIGKGQGDGMAQGTPSNEELNPWEKLSEEGVDPRGAAGQRFAREQQGGKCGAYKAMSTASKAEFRKSWAKNIFQTLRKVKVKSEAWSKIDITKGTYMAFGCIVREEGNDDAAMVATFNYVRACLTMGGVWKKWNVMTKRWEFLYMRQEVHEIFEQSWKIFEESQQGGSPDAMLTTGSSEAKEGAASGKKKGDKKQTGNTTLAAGSSEAKALATGASEAKSKEVVTPRKSPFELALNAALTTRKTYMTVTSKAALVEENIATNKDWVWARGHWQQELSTILTPVRRRATTGFARTFLMQDVKDIKREFTQNDLLNHTVQFSKDFDDSLAIAQKLLNKLTCMQSEAMK